MSWILGTVTSQLPGLIEKYEPKIEETLKGTLIKMKASNPDETELFHTNWKKLNRVIEETLSAPSPAEGGKRTRRKGRKYSKKRKY